MRPSSGLMASSTVVVRSLHDWRSAQINMVWKATYRKDCLFGGFTSINNILYMHSQTTIYKHNFIIRQIRPTPLAYRDYAIFTVTPTLKPTRANTKKAKIGLVNFQCDRKQSCSLSHFTWNKQTCVSKKPQRPICLSARQIQHKSQTYIRRDIHTHVVCTWLWRYSHNKLQHNDRLCVFTEPHTGTTQSTRCARKYWAILVLLEHIRRVRCILRTRDAKALPFRKCMLYVCFTGASECRRRRWWRSLSGSLSSHSIQLFTMRRRHRRALVGFYVSCSCACLCLCVCCVCEVPYTYSSRSYAYTT